MRCAIYARRSTDEHQAASLAVQIGEATRYIERKGWRVASDHVYRDDAVSRAEFKKRPGLIAMLNAAESGGFDAVVLRDESRLGGDMHRTGLVLQDLIEHGVHVFYYFDDEEVQLTGATDKMLIAVRSFAAELEREKISERTREHLLVKARRGLNVGGRVYGYENKEVRDAERRIHVTYEISPTESTIVREIFTRYAQGDGLRAITKDLNARHVAKARVGRRGTGSWSTSAIWGMLRNERYRGVIVWGRREKTYRRGTKVRLPTDPHEWVVVERPELRIVSDELWFAVQAKIGDSRMRNGRKGGRPPRYLLSGMVRCGQCGGPLTVVNHRHGTDVVKVYVCAYHRERGDAVCSSTTRRPVTAVNDLVVDWVQQNVLSEDVILETLSIIRARLEERTQATTSDLPDLERRMVTLRAEIDRLVGALASTDQRPAPIVRAIADRQEELSVLDARIRSAKAAPGAIELEIRRMEAEVRGRLTALREALERNSQSAREVLRAIFPDPMRSTPVETPEGRRFHVAGRACVGNMLTTEFSNVASPTGFEPVLQP